MKLNLISKVLLCTMSVATLLVSLNTNVANAATRQTISNIPAERTVLEEQDDFEEDFGTPSFVDETEEDEFERVGNEEMLRDAVKNHDLERVRYFLENGVDVNASDAYGSTPLYIAIVNSDYEMVLTLLLDYHAQLHTADLNAAYAQARILQALGHSNNADIIDLLHQVRTTVGVVA